MSHSYLGDRMSEGTNSSAPPSETVKPEPTPEPIPAPSKPGKKKLWLVIAAILVVAVLIGSSAYVMFLAPLKVTMEPAGETLSVDAGKLLEVSVKVKKGLRDLTNSDDVEYLWSVAPVDIGDWMLRAKARVNLSAAKEAGTGTVTCTVTYKGDDIVVSKPITVLPPYLDQILITPSTKTLERGMSQSFSASAVDSVATPLTNLVYTWSVSGVVTAELNATTGQSVTLTAGADYGNVTLTATASSGGVTKSGSAQVTIGPLPPRKVDYLWYDMFDVPFGEWWDWRWSIGKTEQVVSSEYPYIFRWYGMPEGNTYLYSNMRLNITGKNVSEINMNERAEFLPMHGNARGGTAVIDWYLQYLTSDEMTRFPAATSAWNDGWVVSLNGTVTLDKQAAMTVIEGLTAEGFDDFDSWWSQHQGEIQTDFSDWFAYEAGKDRLDIYPAYEYTFTMLSWTLEGEKVGDKVVLTYDMATWGMEMLLSMWMREGFMPTEWYFEDMNFHATIGPEWAQIKADTAVAYAVYAYEATNVAHEPVWVWEALVQDYVEAYPPQNRESLFNIYAPETYLNTAPGSLWYDMEMPYDYVPGAWNLSANETLKFVWPDGDQVFKAHAGPNVTVDLVDEMEIEYCEPMETDADALAPGTVSIDNDANTIVYVGPVDMWHWSQTQDAPEHEWLTSEWERLNLLPYGAPYIEWRPVHGAPAINDHIGLTDTPELPLVDTAVPVTVTMYTQFNTANTTFTGTVSFSSNRTGEVTLPADYTFTLADAGVHTFDTLTFLETGYYNISVEWTDDTSVMGYNTNIYVIPSPEVIDHFTVSVPGVQGIMLAGLPADVYVTAHNQYDGRVFKGYSGTVMFETNASDGMYSLPDNYTFSPALEGVAVIPNLLFTESGQFSVTVTDTVTTSATGSTSVIVVAGMDIDYKLYDMFEQPWGEWWPWRLLQYKTDVILNNEPHAYTMVYNPDMKNKQGLIMAPYRWNTTATNMSTLGLNDPEFMPVMGATGLDGASAHLDVYFEYLSWDWWNNYWLPTWSSNDDWTTGMDDVMNSQTGDGYYLGTIYTATMNRAAAETWLNLPQDEADPEAWWAANKDTYKDAWLAWILDEGNVRLDIWPAYEWPYVDVGTCMDFELQGDDIVLKIGHLNWGYEALTTRWMTEIAACTHEPYWEDYTLSVDYEPYRANLTADGVAQYNLHAVKQNASSVEEAAAAWVWEPQNIDYVAMDGSDFTPWEYLTYQSWNAGDIYFGTEVPYDFTPTYFNLTSYMKFTIQLPLGDNVIGYRGEALPNVSPTPIALLKTGNDSMYENITIYGPMWLGYNLTGFGPGSVDLWTMYDNDTKTLVIEGPMSFDNFHHVTGELYHSAPWIEFNVANYTWPGELKMLSVPLPSSAEPISESSVSASMSAEMAALIIAAALSVIAIVSFGYEVKRRE